MKLLVRLWFDDKERTLDLRFRGDDDCARVILLLSYTFNV